MDEKRQAHIAQVRLGIRKELEKKIKDDERRWNAKFREPKPGSKLPPAILEQNRMQALYYLEQEKLVPEGHSLLTYQAELGQVVRQMCIEAATYYPDGPAMRIIRPRLVDENLKPTTTNPFQTKLLLLKIDQARLEVALRHSPGLFRDSDRKKAGIYFQHFNRLRPTQEMKEYWDDRITKLKKATGRMELKEWKEKESFGVENKEMEEPTCELIIELNEKDIPFLSQLCADYGIAQAEMYQLVKEEKEVLNDLEQIQDNPVLLLQHIESGDLFIGEEIGEDHCAIDPLSLSPSATTAVGYMPKTPPTEKEAPPPEEDTTASAPPNEEQGEHILIRVMTAICSQHIFEGFCSLLKIPKNSDKKCSRAFLTGAFDSH
jgi:hypothetical protein